VPNRLYPEGEKENSGKTVEKKEFFVADLYEILYRGAKSERIRVLMQMEKRSLRLISTLGEGVTSKTSRAGLGGNRAIRRGERGVSLGPRGLLGDVTSTAAGGESPLEDVCYPGVWPQKNSTVRVIEGAA